MFNFLVGHINLFLAGKRMAGGSFTITFGEEQEWITVKTREELHDELDSVLNDLNKALAESEVALGEIKFAPSPGLQQASFDFLPKEDK